MFRKLRNKLVLINVSITSVVVLIIFASIYILSTHSANQRPPIPVNTEHYSDEVEDFIEDRLREEKNIAARELLVMLIVSGIAIEIAVVLVSYFLAEEAIKPIKEAYEAQKVFIANASHEIKTPLAAISANLEAADIHNNKWISNIEKETTKLTALNGELLSLARADLAKESPAEDVDLGALVDKLAESFEPRMSQINFEKKVDANNKTRIAVADFSQIFGILMDNAIKYCENDIFLAVSRHELLIRNDGAKISEKNLEHIFERFYQADKTSEGVGLGLSIAKSIADKNGWKLTAMSDNNTTTFILSF